MKKVILYLCTIFCMHYLHAQTGFVRSYATGNYIFCGKALPENFYYIISKKNNNEKDFKVIARLHKPQNEQAVQAGLLSMPQAIIAITKFNNNTINNAFNIIQKANNTDSLYGYALDVRWQYIAGCGWFDDNIEEGNYTYKIQKTSDNGSIETLQEIQHSFPSSPYNATATPVRFKSDENGIEIHYSISDSFQTAGVKILRSKYLENNFQEIDVNTMFSNINGKTVAIINDKNIATNITYSYIAIPYDALGNKGRSDDTLHIIHQPQTQNMGLFTNFKVLSDVATQSNKVYWKFSTNSSVISIDIYRASSYDGNYIRIGSAIPSDTVFIDNAKLEPTVTYYYYAIANLVYGKSFPSARTPVILQGKNINLLPPQNVNAYRLGNIVTIEFENTEPDTKAFNIYRAKGYTGQLIQLATFINDKGNNIISYTDTLPFSSKPEVYSYALTDVNSSYNISPFSERVVIQTSGELPIVYNVNARMVNKQILISWQNVVSLNSAVSFYTIFRASVNENNNKNISEYKQIGTVTYNENSFIDTAYNEGQTYLYTIKTIGLQKEDVSSPSLPAQIFVEESTPITPAEILVFKSGNNAILKWYTPQNIDYTSIKVYRAVKGKEAQLIKELPGNATSFEDENLTKGNTYFYYLVCIVNNKSSKPTDAVSVSIK
ncbi:MAG: hypothetical protein LC122_02970 [Chitinophagales bacterium]|nr:hypothetical protein [Chitinophagales bacterium]